MSFTNEIKQELSYNELLDVFIKAEHEFAVAHDDPERYYKEVSILRQYISQDEKELSKEVY